MNLQPFEIRADAEGVLWLSGELDLEQANLLSQVAAQHLDGQRSVVLDCSELSFLDSSGLRAILTFAATVPEHVVIRNPSGNVRKVFDITGIDERAGVRIESAA
jgi:anti-anti-sigma factor